MVRGMAHGSPFRRLYGGPWKRLRLLQSLVTGLIHYERLETSLGKAQEAQKYVNRLVEIAKRKKTDSNYEKDMIEFWTKGNEEIKNKLLNVLVPRYSEHSGEYTRVAVISTDYKNLKTDMYGRHAVLELKGNPLPPLAITEKNPHSLQNVLIAAAKQEWQQRKEAKVATDG